MTFFFQTNAVVVILMNIMTLPSLIIIPYTNSFTLLQKACINPPELCGVLL